MDKWLKSVGKIYEKKKEKNHEWGRPLIIQSRVARDYSYIYILFFYIFLFHFI